MGKIKDKNCTDLTETKDVMKRWQENTEELYKKDLNVLHNYDGVFTHLKTDTLEYEVKCGP